MTGARAGEGERPRPAATLVLLRDCPRGLEVLLTRRPEDLRFMGGAAVFPGGALAPSDFDPAWEAASTLSRRDAAALVGEHDDAAALAACVAALRESFEEVGFLAADGPWQELDRAAARDPNAFLELCLRHRIVLRTDELVPAGRWVTPLGAPIRFDARFFVARVTPGWEPSPYLEEVADCRWMTPGEALAEVAAGTMLMAPPTIEMLQRLDRYSTADEALSGLRQAGVEGPGRTLAVRLSPLVQLVLAPNPGLLTGPGTNTYIVGSGPSVVIDPAVDDPVYLDRVLAAAGDVAAILVTHRHPDHVGGVAAIAARAGGPVRAHGTATAGGVDVEPLGDGEVVEAGAARLVALHTPGHSSDHLSFLLDGAASLFAGDNVLGEGTAVIAPPDGDMRAYLETLARLRALRIDRIYPGHFRPLDGGTKVIDRYLAHRAEREAKLAAALSAGARTIEEVVASAYDDTPVALHPLARLSALAHLEMLQEDGRVRRLGERWELVPTTKEPR